MRFGSPWLLLLLAVPAVGLAAYALLQRRPPRHAVAFPNLEVLASVVTRSSQWRRHVPAALLALCLCALAIAAARPTAVTSKLRSGATVVLVVDVSGSMRATDVKPTRLDAALTAMLTFVDRSPKGLRIGVVAFSTEPYVITSPTQDHQLVREGIRSIQLGGRTAIGDALARAVELARTPADGGSATPLTAPGSDGTTATPAPGDGTGGPGAGAPGATTLAEGAANLPPAAVVLLSDGAQTSGSFTPDEAAAMAKAAAVRVSTVALGTAGGTLDPGQFGRGGFGPGGGGGFGGRIPVPPDPVTLARVAATTGGKAFTATTFDQVKSIYADLGSSVEKTRSREEVTWIPLAAAIVLLAALALAAVARAPRLP